RGAGGVRAPHRGPHERGRRDQPAERRGRRDRRAPARDGRRGGGGMSHVNGTHPAIARLDGVTDVVRQAGAAMQEALDALATADALLEVLYWACERRSEDALAAQVETVRNALYDGAIQPLDIETEGLRALLNPARTGSDPE